MQQCLPLAVLKQGIFGGLKKTAEGCNSAYRLRYWNLLATVKMQFFYFVATVLTACGIETLHACNHHCISFVATVLTACGIETRCCCNNSRAAFIQLQQCLPLAVLKPKRTLFSCWWQNKLQQCLPLAVLKLGGTTKFFRCGLLYSCNSAYRLRYWNVIIDIRVSIGIKSVATVLTACGIETKHFPYGFSRQFDLVATVLTACGIETLYILDVSLKDFLLQQCLPLAVLKLECIRIDLLIQTCCNSAYRLRYWNRQDILNEYSGGI